MTVIEDVADWVSGLSYDDIPPRVLELARNQVISVLGAIYAGAGCAGGKAVIDTVEKLGGEGPCTVYPGGERRPFYDALLQNCSLSMALDYDDYLFLGHTGHSAVLVPLAMAEMRGVDMRTVLAAQVAANEVAGRLGGTVVLGPHNGQMWAHIHLLGAAAAASKILGLDQQRTADALGIALAEPVYPLFPAFMGPQSKLLTATVHGRNVKRVPGPREALADQYQLLAVGERGDRADRREDDRPRANGGVPDIKQGEDTGPGLTRRA